MPIRKEQSERIAGAKLNPLPSRADFKLAEELEVSGDLFEAGGCRIVFDQETELAIGFPDAEVQEKCHQPVARRSVIVLRQDTLHARSVILARGQVRAEKEMITWPQQRCQTRQDGLGIEIRQHAEEGDDS